MSIMPKLSPAVHKKYSSLLGICHYIVNQNSHNFCTTKQCTRNINILCSNQMYPSVTHQRRSSHIQTHCLSKRQQNITSSSAPRLVNLNSHFHTSTAVLKKKHIKDTQNEGHLSSGKKPVKVRFTEDLDLKKIAEEVAEERRTGNTTSTVHARVSKILLERCDAYIANMSPEELKSLKVIQLEHSFMYSEGYEIPMAEEMTSVEWVTSLLDHNTKFGRLRYYSFLNRKMFKKQSKKQKQVDKRKAREEGTYVRVPTGLELNSYEHGRIFHRIYHQTIKSVLNQRMISTLQYGTPLIFDMDFEQYMPPRECKNTAKQLEYVLSENRYNTDPFHLHFLNCKENNSIYKYLDIYQEGQDLYATVSDKSYLDMFDKDELIYLSPDAQHVMKEYDPKAVYIIGAFNDKAKREPVSFARAKKLGIKCQKLPLDKYLLWEQGGKDLTLNQMIQIMMTMKLTGSWTKAFQHIPLRKASRPY